MEWLTGYAAFHWVATWANPALDGFFRVITDVGSHLLYFLVCAPLFWVVDRRRASVLFLLVLFSAYVNTIAKLGFNTPRPDPSLARVVDLRPFQEHNASFPSGHTQGAIVFWSFVALWAGRRWVTAICGAMIVLIAFSRVYLGAHFPIDIVGGTLLGVLSMWLGPRPLHRWSDNDFRHGNLLPLALLLAIIATVLTRDPSMAMLTGCFLGFFAAAVWLPQPPPITGSPARRAAIAITGVVLLLPLTKVLAAVANEPVLLFLSVAALWLVALWLYPIGVARLLGLAHATVELE